jgi:hypothetical protein
MLIPKDDTGNPTLKSIALFDHMHIFHNTQHASAKGKGTDEDEMTVMSPRTNIAVQLPRFSEKHAANCKSAMP